MGFKLALIMFVVMGVVGGIAYWYYHDTQEKIAILHENNAKLEVATTIQKQAIESLEQDIIEAREIVKKTEQLFAAARAQVDDLRDKFNKTSALLGKRDIGTLGQAKPKVIAKVVTRGTKNINRCFEIISGSLLTEKEVNAEKPSQLNSSCPTIANPNRVQ
jgi:uncharacterized coiled-coil protein SlyX